MKATESWQARDVLAVFEKMNRRPGDTLPVQTLWHALLRRDVVVTGLDWLAKAGYVTLNDRQTAVTLTEAGYKAITGDKFPEGRNAPQPTRRRAIILTALEVETRAVLRHLPEYQEEVVRDTVFCAGSFNDWDIAVAEIGPGNHSAAVISERAIQHFNPQVAFFVGIAGGIKDVALGDVVVATKVYGYETGKDDKSGFKIRPDILVTAHALEQRARTIRLKPDWRERIQRQVLDSGPRIYVEPIAAGEKVVASTRGATAKFLRAYYSDAVAVEMEGRGFLEGVHVNSPVLGCVVRGISDLLDGKSASDRQGWQERAVDAASAVVFEILATLPAGTAAPARPVADATVSTAPGRVPLADFRDWAAEAGWCSDVQATAVGDNDWWTFSKRLHQAAVDGEISFWGRRYVYDFGEELDTEPLVRIPIQHFETFGFDPARLAQADNYEIFTGTLGDPPSAWKGRIFRDLHVDAEEARKWLAASGAAPPSANIAVSMDLGARKLGDYEILCSLIIENVGPADLEDCLLEVTEISGRRPPEMPMPFVLRTDQQIRADERGRFTLSRGQKRAVPLAFRRTARANEWFFIDEDAKAYFRPSNPTKMIVRIYGGPAPGNALVYIDVDAGWNPFPSVRVVPSDYTLDGEQQVRPTRLSEAATE